MAARRKVQNLKKNIDRKAQISNVHKYAWDKSAVHRSMFVCMCVCEWMEKEVQINLMHKYVCYRSSAFRSVKQLKGDFGRFQPFGVVPSSL